MDDFLEHYLADPFAALAEMRAQPVREIELPATGRAWVITRYGDVRAALTDPRFVKDPRNTPATGWRLPTPAAQMMLANDPPVHDRLRGLAADTFAPRQTALLRPLIERTAHGLLDGLPGDRAVDLVDVYATALPTLVVCGLLGLPDADRYLWREWTAGIMDEVSPSARRRGNDRFGAYLDELVRRRRECPDDGLVSRLAVAPDGPSDAEIAGLAMMLLLAAHETMGALLGSGIEAILRDPRLRTRLAGADDAEMSAAVEELLRWVAPKPATPRRFTTEDVTLGAATIPAGSPVLFSLAAANHDPARYDAPDLVDVDRDTGGHLAFGRGVHHCLGAPLARVIAPVAFRALLTRRPDAALATDRAPDRRHSIRVNAPSSLPVVLGAGPARAAGSGVGHSPRNHARAAPPPSW